MLPNVSIAPNHHKLPHYVHLAGTICTHLLALYWLMVFIHETHVMPSSGKVKTKRHLFSYLVLAGSECWPMCQSLQTETNYHIMYFWLVQVAPQLVALYWLMVFIHETHVMPSSGKVKTKSHLFSYFVIAGSECCPMRQLLQTGTHYHITYMCLVLVALIFRHWWCLFMKLMWYPI